MTTRIKPIIVVQGAQWGSEAKGAVAAWLCQVRKMKYAVRTGAVNAGHTVMYGGLAQKMQQLPTGWVNPNTQLVLGAGTFVHPEILAAEIRRISEITGSNIIRERLLVDHRVSLHLPVHQNQSKIEDHHHTFGATGKGCSMAIVDKLMRRGRGYQLFKEWMRDESNSSTARPEWLKWLIGIKFVDTVELLHSAYDAGEGILLEGTQGSLLDLHLGPYPFTTHKQTQAAQWVTEAGLSPNMEYEIAMIARTYPIRVAGNSGPMGGETTWPNIARVVNKKLMLHRLPQRVRSFALEEFEKTMHSIANNGAYALPHHLDGSVNYDMHKWTAEERKEYRVALSELHADVMNNVSLNTYNELAQLFEFTTVTNKLRRVAEWTGQDVRRSVRMNRGSYVVLTFFNYWFPELWLTPTIDWGVSEYARRVREAATDAGVPVKFVTTGPGPEHIISVPAAIGGGMGGN